MAIRGFIFDLDGVIVDTAKYHFLAWKRLADQLNIDFSERDNERLKGVSRMKSLDIILELGSQEPVHELKSKYAALKNEWYVDYISKMTPAEILPGSIEFLTELKNAGKLTAIGSASKNTTTILERLSITDLFDAVVDGNLVSKAKPDPEVFLIAARLLRLEPAECVVFEDAIAGVQAALAAGMICVGIGSPSVLKKAQIVVGGLNGMNLRKIEEIENNIRI